MRGGPTRNATYPMVDTVLTQAAAVRNSSAALDMPTGNPSEDPRPHAAIPTETRTGPLRKITPARPAAAKAALTRSTCTRPKGPEA